MTTGAHPQAGLVTYIRSQEGLSLAARSFGSYRTDRLPLLCLPGLSRNSRDFIALGNSLGAERQVIAVDYRGRGLSDSDPDWRNYSPLVEARDALTVATAFGVEQAVVLGTSRGGIIAMLLGALRPGLLGGVILNDIGPVVEGTGLARIKAYLKGRSRVRSWDDAIIGVRRSIGTNFPALSEEDWRAYAEATFAERGRGLEPQFDRALLKILQPIDFTSPIPTLWPQFDSLKQRKLMTIRGQFSDILSVKTVEAMGRRHPEMETLVVRGQGHAPLLRDDETLESLEEFARRCDPETGRPA